MFSIDSSETLPKLSTSYAGTADVRLECDRIFLMTCRYNFLYSFHLAGEKNRKIPAVSGWSWKERLDWEFRRVKMWSYCCLV